MNELQHIEFDMLKVFIDICNKLNIKYYLVCGSCLGAVKYGGFIPWDDDLDVGMLREDYECFCSCAQDLLPKHLFLQRYDTEKRYPHIFSKIRNNDTTFIEKTAREIPMNHGVYIDVFPIDGYPDDEREAKKIEKNKRRFASLQSCAFVFSGKSIRGSIARQVKRALRFHKRTVFLAKKLTKTLSSYSTSDSKLWCNHGNWQGKLEYAPREQYGNGTWATFEGLKVRIPERYDDYLTQKYGSWRADLPEDQKVGHHYAEVIDLHRPYTDYIVKLKNGRIRLKTSEELLSSGITPPEGYKY